MKLFEVNKNIAEIREHIVPITSTAIGDKYPKIIFDIKHPRAGEIMSFSEAQQRANTKGYNLSKTSYYRIRKELENSIVFKQTEPSVAYDIARTNIIHQLDTFYEKQLIDEDLYNNLYDFSDIQLIDLYRRAAEEYNEFRKEHKGENYGSKFFEYIEKELQEMLKDLE